MGSGFRVQGIAGCRTPAIILQLFLPRHDHRSMTVYTSARIRDMYCRDQGLQAAGSWCNQARPYSLSRLFN